MARRKRGEDDKITSNLTAALDVIFNILAFFVMTFNPPKPEKNFDITLPPIKPPESSETTGDSIIPPTDIEIEDVAITLKAGPDGRLAGIFIEGQGVPPSIPNFVQRLSTTKSMLSAGDVKVDAATITADPTLKYVELMRIVDAMYHRVGIKKINFSAPAGGGGGGGGGDLPF